LSELPMLHNLEPRSLFVVMTTYPKASISRRGAVFYTEFSQHLWKYIKLLLIMILFYCDACLDYGYSGK
jgi:hypothetical protein